MSTAGDELLRRQNEEPTDVIDLSDWEHCKENIVPLRRGRNARQLAEVCALEAPPSSIDARIESQKKAWEDEIANYAGDDPLDLWSRYVDWAQQSIVAVDSRQQLIVLIERCTKKFTGEALARYREDPRLLRLWLAYTDYCEDPLEVFSYLKTNKIGEKDAVFYERWASALEHRGNQALCQKVYEAGILKGAHPVDWLKTRHKAFQMRLVQKIKPAAPLQGGASASASASSSSLSSARRPALASLSSSSRAPTTGLRPSTQLTGMTARAGTSSSTLLNMPSGGVRLGSIASRSGSSSSSSSAFASAPNGKTLKSEIYVDPPHITGKPASTSSNIKSASDKDELPHVALQTECSATAEGKWHTLAPLQERQKENRPVPLKWSETTLPQNPTKAKPQPTESFAIFVDDQFQ